VAEFTVSFERDEARKPGAYFFRASADGGTPEVCSIVFEPVLGAVSDSCNNAGLRFSVSYVYDTSAQKISSVSFDARVRKVDLELLVSEAEPPLAELHYQIPASSLHVGVCGCVSIDPLSVPIGPLAARDAGSDAAAGGASGASDSGADAGTNPGLDAGASDDAGVVDREDAGAP
jgi:hypothetical protein